MTTTTNVIHPKALAGMRVFFRFDFHDMVKLVGAYSVIMTDEEKATFAAIENCGDFFDAFDVFIDGLNAWDTV